MKLKLIFITLLASLFWVATASAFDVPAIDGHVTDRTGNLSQEDKNFLNGKLEDVNKTSGNEIAVLVIPTLNGEAPEDVGYTVARAWKLGKKDQDNGVLLLIAMQEHKVRIEVGKGIGGALTDIQSVDIIKRNIAPQMKHGNLRGAIEDGTFAIASAINPGPGSTQAASGAKSINNDWGTGLIFGSLFCAAIGAVVFLMRRQDRKADSDRRFASSHFSPRTSTYSVDEDSYTARSNRSPVSPLIAPIGSYTPPPNRSRSSYVPMVIPTAPAPISSRPSPSYSSDSDSSSSSSSSDYGSSSSDSGGFSGGGGDFGGGGGGGDW